MYYFSQLFQLNKTQENRVRIPDLLFSSVLKDPLKEYRHCMFLYVLNILT